MGRSRAAPWKGTERTWAWLIQVGDDEEEGRRGEGREHARAVGSDAAADEDVPGAKEDPRRGVERGVDLAQPALPSDTLAKLEALGTKSEQKPKEEI